jgi:hypothetical protein
VFWTQVGVNDADNVLETRLRTAIAARQVKDRKTVLKKSSCEHGQGEKEEVENIWIESRRRVGAFRPPLTAANAPSQTSIFVEPKPFLTPPDLQALNHLFQVIWLFNRYFKPGLHQLNQERLRPCLIWKAIQYRVKSDTVEKPGTTYSLL